jgi:hypothetical protein
VNELKVTKEWRRGQRRQEIWRRRKKLLTLQKKNVDAGFCLGYQALTFSKGFNLFLVILTVKDLKALRIRNHSNPQIDISW